MVKYSAPKKSFLDKVEHRAGLLASFCIMAGFANQYLRSDSWRESRRAIRAWLGMAAKRRLEPANDQAAEEEGRAAAGPVQPEVTVGGARRRTGLGSSEDIVDAA